MSSTATRSAVPALAVEDVLKRSDAVLIDLRSPSEFEADHLPGAVSVPLFDDRERALIGTLYARSSREAAFEEGRELTRERIRSLTLEVARAAGWHVPDVDLVRRVDEITAGGIDGMEGALMPRRVRAGTRRPVVLYCWRGGLRSRSVAVFLRELGLDEAVVLEGGYRCYRGQVLEELERLALPEAFVLRGLTGVGKTLVLRELATRRPDWVVDLEALASHRSSILGMVGLEPCTQRTFETRLVVRVRAGLGPLVVFEGESRKVGDVVLPARLWGALDGGTNLELTAPYERRIEILAADYLGREANRDELARQLPFLERRLGAKYHGALVGLLREGREHELIALLLERYYDPVYRHSEEARRYAATFEASDPQAAARAVERHLLGHLAAAS
jgi:tRNA 2-selenouridine synthase